ncbi:hypothetical protein T552_02807 [Pneumocystis carinii B80]|uniref:Uncharacterized protein n=1 Tax=Pneumocystis carinii (strain B80) TaxID=1408658 RepID=A0A0W4ZD83_PNEC8|nr:hypothetical protein T552_02807 [Pneumocystis carinii B80]KTW26321.1 hypothetical protein T552_02807 [Pneumocystis carinii B80]
MGNSGDRCDNKWISLTNRSDPPWKSLSTVAYTSMSIIAATTGYVFVRPARKPVNISKTVTHIPLEEGQNAVFDSTEVKQQKRLLEESWRSISLTSLPTLSMEFHSVPSISLRKWSKKHELQHKEWESSLSKGYDVAHTSIWKPYFAPFKARKKFFSKSSKCVIRQLYPFKSKRPAVSLVPIQDIDSRVSSSIFSMDSIYDLSNDSIFFSDPEFVSYKHSASPPIKPLFLMKDIPLNVYSVPESEKRVFNNDIYPGKKCNVRVDQIFDVINPLSKLMLDDREIYELQKSSNKQLFSTTSGFSDENFLDKIELLNNKPKKSIDNTSNDILWDNFNEVEYTDQKKIYESSTSTNIFLMNERVPNIYSKYSEFQWNDEYRKKESDEAWDDDFDTELIVPIDIAERQDTIKSHLGSIRKFASLIEDLKDLRRIAQKEGDKDEIWPEVEAIIALGTLENDVPDMHEENLNNSTLNQKQNMLREVIMRALGKQFPTGERIGLDPDNLPGFVNYASSLKERCQGIINPIHHTLSNINR